MRMASLEVWIPPFNDVIVLCDLIYLIAKAGLVSKEIQSTCFQ